MESDLRMEAERLVSGLEMQPNHDIQTCVVEVDATLAGLYLSKNTINRHINETRVNSYAQQMKQGQWRLNGEPIIVGTGMKLLDGQHRLKAIRDNNLKVKMLFVFGIDESAFDTINTGDRRTNADVLEIMGVDSSKSKTLGTCIRSDLIMRLTGSLSVAGKISRKITPHIVAEKAKTEPKYHLSVDYILEHRTKSMPLSAGILSFLLYRFIEVSKDIETSKDWMLGFITGANLSDADPRLWIKNKIWREFSKQAKTSYKQRAGFAIRAWHLMRTNRSIKYENNLYRDPMDAYKYIAMHYDKLRK